MYKKLICFILYSFVFSETVLHDFGYKKIFASDFFYETPKNQWIELDSLKQKEAFDSFIKKELVLHESFLLGLEHSPDVLKRLKEREKQVLVNHYYEREVALPLVEPFYLENTSKNIERELLVYHVLFGYEGCALEGSFLKKEVVLDSVLVHLEKLKNNLSASENKLETFKGFAKKHSNDPSVVNNNGYLGWVSWGRSIDDFQLPLFLLKKGEISSPILTPYGFHVVYIEEERPSSFSYYNKDLVKDFSNKAALQSLSFDLLKETSTKHDSILLKDVGFAINDVFVEETIKDLELFIKKSNLRGGKKTYLDFLKNNKPGVLFVYNNKGFGLGWLKNKISQTPSTRIPLIKTKQDFSNLLSDFIIQEEVVLRGYNKNILSLPLVAADFSKHKKNIIYNAYVKHLNNSLALPDSSIIKKIYEEGLKDSSFYSPSRSLVYDLNFSSLQEADSVLVLLNKGVSFESLFSPLKQKKQIKTINKGSMGPLGDAAFSLTKNQHSSVIKNTDKTFSIIKSIDFQPPSPLPFLGVYKEIESKYIKNSKKDIKKNIYKNLKAKHSFSFNYKDLL